MSMSRMVLTRAWRESSSLVVLAKHGRDALSHRHNYDILVQTRPSGASSFANSVVFPGGVAETADASTHWFDLIKSFGYTNQHFEALHKPGSVVNPIFHSSPIERHISLRITAIRETFEELGVLICSREKSQDRVSSLATVYTDFDVKKWQAKVSEDPTQLYTLCRELECYPDIWSLHYWSNWLTPSAWKKRFDTAFFVVGLTEKPINIKNSSEVVKAEWRPSSDLLAEYKKGKLVLFPPQEYELLRLSKFDDLDELVKFASKRSSEGNELLYPIDYQTSDGMVQILPGDDLYPPSVDYNGKIIKVSDKTSVQLREGCNTLHRLEINNNKRRLIVYNYTPRNHIKMNDTNVDY